MPAADWHDAPILYIAGNQALDFTPAEKARLKAYVTAGGLILGNADCADRNFSDTFQRLGQELFPQCGAFRPLPATHPINTIKYKNTILNRLIGLSDGSRELMLLFSGGDPAAFWQIRNFASAQAKALSELAVNIYLYSR